MECLKRNRERSRILCREEDSRLGLSGKGILVSKIGLLGSEVVLSCVGV